MNTLFTDEWYSKEKMTERGHRVVLSTFCPLLDDSNYQVNHIDGNKSNNNLSNLEWCTCKENIQHAIQHKLTDNTKQV